jgi:hypothetical protein
MFSSPVIGLFSKIDSKRGPVKFNLRDGLGGGLTQINGMRETTLFPFSHLAGIMPQRDSRSFISILNSEMSAGIDWRLTSLTESTTGIGDMNFPLYWQKICVESRVAPISPISMAAENGGFSTSLLTDCCQYRQVANASITIAEKIIQIEGIF